MTGAKNDSCFVLLNQGTFHVKHFCEKFQQLSTIFDLFSKNDRHCARQIRDSSLRSE